MQILINLRYFTHDEFVGVAAFKQIEAAEAERNARFVSVGILAAQEDIWQHADTLHRFARCVQCLIHGFFRSISRIADHMKWNA